MQTRPVMISANENNILFDDHALLKAVLGNQAQLVSSINTNCDCDGYYPNPNDEDLDSHSITKPTATIN